MSVSRKLTPDGPIWEAVDTLTAPDHVMIDPKQYWWNQRGLCPNCHNQDNPPKCQPGGSGFICPICAWEVYFP